MIPPPKTILRRLGVALVALSLGLAGTASAKDKVLKIGYSSKTLSAPYFAAQVAAAQEAAKKAGYTFVSTDAQDSLTKQIADVEDLLSQKIDVLLINPKDPKGMVQATKTATVAKVPVVIVDSSIDPSADYVTVVQSSNTANGQAIGEWLISTVGDKELKIGLLSGEQGNPVGQERREGVFQGINEAQLRKFGRTGFKVLGQGWGKWTQEGGLKAAEDLLTAHPDVNMIMGENDSMVLGALRALEDAGKKDVLVFAAADGQKEALKLIMEGKYGATGRNDPAEIARTALDIGVKAATGKLPANFSKLTLLEPVAITKENVAKFYKQDAVF